jgi:threonine/homoserine/homoserine lactone efflux protein
MSLFINGVTLGLSIAAPVGPIGVLCIRRTLAEGRLVGWLSGLGAASADAAYGALAALGFSLAGAVAGPAATSGPLYTLLRIAGGLFLLYLGVSTWRSRPAAAGAGSHGEPRGAGGLLRAYLSTFFLTLTNPLTIASFAAMFVGLGVESDGWGAAVLVAGVFCGSALWWSLLSGGVGFFRGALERHTIWINRLAALVIIAFAVVILF